MFRTHFQIRSNDHAPPGREIRPQTPIYAEHHRYRCAWAITEASSTTTSYNVPTISWNHDEASVTQIDYGTGAAYGTTTTLDPTFVTAHSQTLTGIRFSTPYHFRLKSATQRARERLERSNIRPMHSRRRCVMICIVTNVRSLETLALPVVSRIFRRKW